MIRPAIFFLFLCLLIQSCANQTQPTGGPKDEDPPELLSSYPANGATNFTDRRIELTFNENVQLKTAKSQILITPRIDVDYEIKVRRETVILEFDSLLDANTTYTISFRESIQDLTEGNPAQQLQLAFSTGPQLDSLTISGNVYHLLSGSIPERSTVVLYRETDTTHIFTDLPYYFTETSDSGKFTLQNIKQGNYRIYAFNDYNSNLKAESNKEPYAFLDHAIQLDSNTVDISLPLVNLDLSPLRLLSSRPSGTTYSVKYNKSITSVSVASEDSSAYTPDQSDPSLINIYKPPSYAEPDSIFTILTVTDSLAQTSADTVFTTFNTASRRSADYSQRNLILPILLSQPQVEAHIEFNKPSTILNPDSIYLQLDSLNRISLDSMKYHWNNIHTSLTITHVLNKDLFSSSPSPQIQPEQPTSPFRPFFRIGSHSFRSIENDTSKAVSLQLSFLRESDLSKLIINIASTLDHFILQLVDGDGTIIREITDPASPTVYFNNLEPGTYQLRAIVDANRNGQWDPGNFNELIVPERIIYFVPNDGNIEMQLRANFDREETFNIR